MSEKKLRKIRGIQENEYGEFMVRITINGSRKAPINFTKKYNCHSLKETENKVREIHELLDMGINPFDSRNFDEHINDYFDGLSESTAYIAKKVYEKYAKLEIGYLKPDKISKDHIETIYHDMIKSGNIKSKNSLVKMRNYLAPTFNKLHKENQTKVNVIELAKIPKIEGDVTQAPLNIRLKDQKFETVLQKMYRGIIKIEYEPIKYHLIMALLTMRRRSELFKTPITEISNDVVFANIDITKTNIDERYIIPQEVLEYLKGFKKKYPFNADEHAILRAWDKVKKEEGIEYRQKFSPHDARHLFQSIMSKKFNRDLVGACISHHQGDINAVYQSFEFDDRKDVFRKYWEIARKESTE